jgi:putative transposase
MPWKECSVMDERLQFVARRLAGEAMAELCREFGISRKTGYKIAIGNTAIRSRSPIMPAGTCWNGRHARMHLTLKKEATKPAAANFLQQQARFDKFIDIFNNERPHEALDMKCPVEIYQPSSRSYTGLPDLDYPFHDKTVVVTCCGRICLGKKKINLRQVFAGQAVGIKEVHDDIWLVSFMEYDLGYFDLETRVLEPIENPFGPKVLPM